MWKYIVTWIIVKVSVIACPPVIEYDEFGREIEKLYEPSLGCYQYDTIQKEKYFDKRKDATDFIKRGQDRKAQGWDGINTSGSLEQFKLDSFLANPPSRPLHNQ